MSGRWPPAAEATDAELRGNGGANDMRLSVDVLNINVGTGDSGLFLLIQHPPETRSEVKPFIHRAVLIDGGIGKTGARAIERALKKVAELYFWDQTQGGRDPNQLPWPPLDSIAAAKGGLFDPDTYLCPLMKYEAGALGSPRNTRARTTFYAPYWEGPKFPGRARVWRESTDDAARYLPKGLGANAYIHWKYRNDDTHLGENICKLRTHVDVVLGVNLFIGDTTPQMDMATALAMPTPQHLALWHKNGGLVGIPNLLDNPPTPYAAWPVLCIVAGATGGLGAARNSGIIIVIVIILVIVILVVIIIQRWRWWFVEQFDQPQQLKQQHRVLWRRHIQQ
ncbi:hypothetical protein NEMBOFW57_004581 [Staphylotrichum longicolle]|uniref:Uncharacterized protein n=1 Tax=Staphylotrichum longicolle TaxID=669026 RepID=A0AAD4F741_9PEZI|nr:hypothetical protein NEMBOFW57_004581 [Staphylotrichum longicolle]